MFTRLKTYLLQMTVMVGCVLFASNAFAAKNSLTDVKIRGLANGQGQIMLSFEQRPMQPKSFTVDNPASLVFDFQDVELALSEELTSQTLSIGVMKGMHFVDDKLQTRLIIDVARIVPTNIQVDGNSIIITVAGDVRAAAPQQSNSIKSLDFRRSDQGSGRLIIDLSSEEVSADFREENGKLIVEFYGATIPTELLRRFDVSDFATPMKKVVVNRQAGNVMVEIEATGEYEKIGYQIGSQYIIETRPLSQREKELIKSQTFKFTGERISLNFQDVDVRSVLQLLADFTGLNIVASDTVSGNVTLRLESVPWDQALHLILKSKGLGQRKSGNVIMIAPNSEIVSEEQAELEAQKTIAETSPMRSEFIQINYAKADTIVTMLQGEDFSLLSTDGKVSADIRTNTLLIKDTEDKINEIKDLIQVLDIPIRQVMIESQILLTTDNIADVFGVRFGGAATARVGHYQFGFAGEENDGEQAAGEAEEVEASSGLQAIQQARNIADSGNPSASNGLFFDNQNTPSGLVGRLGKIGLAVARLPGGTLLDVELQALESENKGKVIARPKLLTLDQQTASIESGEEIPFQTVSEEGTQTEFRNATLKLEVTPQITPNDHITLNLNINRDSRGEDTPAGPAINTQNIDTTILVDNGETIVLGGIYDQNDQKQASRVPFFGRLPVVGRLFRNDNSRLSRSELLFFVTPKIVTQAFRG